MEQMLTFAGRTLHEHKGYAMPEDPEAYLAGFTDAADISAREAIAAMTRRDLWGCSLYSAQFKAAPPTKFIAKNPRSSSLFTQRRRWA